METLYKKDIEIYKKERERLNERTRESLEQFFDYQLSDIKDKAMDIQNETQNAIDSFVEDFNINEEV